MGSGLGGAGIGLAGGLKDVATAPFTGTSNPKATNTADTPNIAKAHEEVAEEKKAGPRKIELRSAKT